MKISHMFLVLSLLVVIEVSHCQFFTKIGSNSIPRMGRRSKSEAKNISELVRRVAKTLRFVIEMVQKYDEDASGELSPEELMDVPLIQNTVRSYMEEQELRGQYPVTEAEERTKPKRNFIVTETEERTKPKRPYDQRLIM